MAKTDLKVKSVYQGQQSSTTVSYVNSQADSSTLVGLATRLVAFTNGTYSSADRVNTINVDTEQVPGTGTGGLPDPNLSVVQFKSSIVELNYDGNAMPQCYMLHVVDDPIEEQGFCAQVTLTQTVVQDRLHRFTQFGGDPLFDEFIDGNTVAVILLPATSTHAAAWTIYTIPQT